MSAPPWLHEEAGALVLTLHIQPGARTSEVAGLHGEALKIRLAAPPVDGKANAALIEFLAQRLDIPRTRIDLISGTSLRHKRLRIHGAMPPAVIAALS